MNTKRHESQKPETRPRPLAPALNILATIPKGFVFPHKFLPQRTQRTQREGFWLCVLGVLCGDHFWLPCQPRWVNSCPFVIELS